VIIAITDPRWPIDHVVGAVERIHTVLPRDAFMVQIRDKTSAPDRLAERLCAIGVRFVLNGTPEDAVRVGAEGVHLPGDAPDLAHARAVLGEDAWISIAAHDDDAVTRAVAGRATAALVSPIFETPGKGAPRGVEALTRAKSIAKGRVRIIALGGIDSRRAASCALAGADGIAVIRAIWEASDPGAAALELTARMTSLTDRP
jgi:thiamine-phosphate pyrophosphorylase